MTDRDEVELALLGRSNARKDGDRPSGTDGGPRDEGLIALQIANAIVAAVYGIGRVERTQR